MWCMSQDIKITIQGADENSVRERELEVTYSQRGEIHLAAQAAVLPKFQEILQIFCDDMKKQM
jgi:hypothetical protein